MAQTTCKRSSARIPAPVPAGSDGQVTLVMVARAAGVSPSTVSRILNGTAIVSDDKRRAVDDAVSRLGFIPNPVARGLAGGRTLSIGVITQSLSSPFYGAALMGIESELNNAGYSPLFVSGHWDAAREARCIDELKARRVDGIIVLTGRLSDESLRRCAQSMPTVITGRDLSADNLCSLKFDDQAGGLLATRHLTELGHRRIAFISGAPGHPDAAERLRGYREGLKQAGLPYNARLVASGEFHEESGTWAAQSLLKSGERFSAIFAANDQMAFGALLALHRHGLTVPGDISLIGFDDLPGSLYSTPSLTTIHQPAYELGTLSAGAMLSMLGGQCPSPQLPPPRLVVRDSSKAIARC